MDHNPNTSGDGENPLEGLFSALFGASDLSQNEEFQALMAGNAEQLALCAGCPHKEMCGIYAAYIAQQGNHPVGNTSSGISAAKVAEILEDRRVKSSLRKSIDMGVYNALDERDFLQHSIVLGLLKYDEYKREAKRQAARRFWHAVASPFVLVGKIIAFPFVMLGSGFLILFEATNWHKVDDRIKAQLADTEAYYAGDEDYTKEKVAEILADERTGLLEDLNIIERTGYRFGRWINNQVHRQPQAAPTAVKQPIQQPTAESPAVEVNLGEAAQAADENLLNPEE